MKRNHRIALAVLMLFALSGGCTSNKMHRTVSVEENPGYSLAFIEFDDMGEMWDSTQLTRALDVIDRANQSPDGAVLVTFIHGWQNNASEKSEESGNVGEFKEYLETIAGIAERSGLGDRHLVGVYLGWRGKSGTIPGVNLLTFYDRAGAARRISGTTSTEVIYRLMKTAKQNRETRVLLMGHSFGGQILESAVTQAMVGELLGSEETKRDFPADLVVLINPAAKSIQAKQFIGMLDRSHLEVYRTTPDGTRYKAPLIVSITSNADLATRWAFPAGTWVSSVGKDFHKYAPDSCLQFPKQRSFYTQTPGHNDALVSHEVTAEPLAAGQEPAKLEGGSRDFLDTEFDPVTGQYVFSFNGEKYRFTVRSLTGAPNNTPYWIMQVPRQLIPGHSGFFTSDTLRLIGALIQISGAVEMGVTTELVHDSRVRPNSIETLTDGRVLVADASRRLYEVFKDRSSPRFYGCLPASADPSSNIGFELDGKQAYTAISRPTGKSTRKGTDEYETLLYPVVLEDDGLAPGKPRRLESTERFLAAAFDLDNRRVFLAGPEGKVIHQVQLGEKKKPVPELFLDVSDSGVISHMHYHNQTGALLAAGGEDGELWRLTEQGEGPVPTLIATDLGWPVGLAIDDERRIIYVGDAKGDRIWRIECPEPGQCNEPTIFLQAQMFASPSELAVAVDGTLWVADREGRVIVALSPEGEVLQTITELPRE